MPAPRQLPDNSVLVGLRRDGMKYAEIAKAYGVSEAAVYLRLRQANATKRQPSYKHLLPWSVKRSHTFAYPAQMLRLLGRREKGDVLAQPQERMLDRWLREIEEAQVVVCYNQDMPPNPASSKVGGFYYKRRRPEDRGSIIREHDEVDASILN